MQIDLVIPAGATRAELDQAVARRSGSRAPYRILRQSIDARKKPRILLVLRIAVGEAVHVPVPEELLEVPRHRQGGRALVVGLGPAGFFAADILNRAGFEVTVIEQGTRAEERRHDIEHFEERGGFSKNSNYAFGEGGAGTFSDGKLTSRSKHVSSLREYVTEKFVGYGAPEEIRYLAHPHIGSDNLYNVVRNSSQDLIRRGVEILYETRIEDLLIRNGRCVGVRSSDREWTADLTIIAPGHSSFALMRRLIAQGASFTPKGFAVGFRVEHPRELINLAQWGVREIPGLKAAEYRLTARAESGRSVYSFCMCPGGKVVPAAWGEGINIVNGVSNYKRDGNWSNAAVVAAVKPEEMFPGVDTAAGLIDNLEKLEQRCYELFGAYGVPASRPGILRSGKEPASLGVTSYPFDIFASDYRSIYPGWLVDDLADGLEQFRRRLKGYEEGLILGVETTTSSVVQAVRTPAGDCEGLPGLYLAGEGSGSAGGIMSSAIDAIRMVLTAIN